MASDKKISLQKAVEMAAWSHNMNTSILGFNPLQLVTGKAVIIPGISTGYDAMDSPFDSENVRRIMERTLEINKVFRETDFGDKLMKASIQRKRMFTDENYKEDDLVFYQSMRNKAWVGPVKVFCQKGCNVFLWANGKKGG
jgi:hypothetical protein